MVRLRSTTIIISSGRIIMSEKAPLCSKLTIVILWNLTSRHSGSPPEKDRRSSSRDRTPKGRRNGSPYQPTSGAKSKRSKADATINRSWRITYYNQLLIADSVLHVHVQSVLHSDSVLHQLSTVDNVPYHNQLSLADSRLIHSTTANATSPYRLQPKRGIQ